jgi:hypothetical protein
MLLGKRARNHGGSGDRAGTGRADQEGTAGFIVLGHVRFLRCVRNIVAPECVGAFALGAELIPFGMLQKAESGSAMPTLDAARRVLHSVVSAALKLSMKEQKPTTWPRSPLGTADRWAPERCTIRYFQS